MITSEKKAKEVFISCIDEMYRNSVPSITWEEILKKYTGKHDWYLKHKLSEETYMKIKEKYQKKLHKMYHRDLDWFLLDYSPTFY
jgi:predicted nucleic acid-binding protein